RVALQANLFGAIPFGGVEHNFFTELFDLAHCTNGRTTTSSKKLMASCLESVPRVQDAQSLLLWCFQCTSRAPTCPQHARSLHPHQHPSEYRSIACSYQFSFYCPASTR